MAGRKKFQTAEFPTQEFSENTASENVEQIFSLLSQPKVKSRRKKFKIEGKTRKGSESVVSTAVQSLSRIFESNKSVPPHDQASTRVKEETLNGSNEKQWHDAVLFRLSFEPLIAFVARAGINRSTMRNMENPAKSSAKSNLTSSEKLPRSHLLRRLITSAPKRLEAQAGATFDPSTFFDVIEGDQIEAQYTLSYVQEIKASLECNDAMLTFDQTYWKHRCTKNRSLIPIAEAATVPAFHDALFDDGDLLEQIDVYLKNTQQSPPFQPCTGGTRKSKFHRSQSSSSFNNLQHVNENAEITKLQGFSSLQSSSTSCTPAILHSLFSD